MLPSLALLNSARTGPPAKRKELTLGPWLLELPPEVLEKIVNETMSDRGVPLLMVRKQVNNTLTNVVTTKNAYLQLPYPSQFNADTNAFEDDYAFAELLEGLMDYAGYPEDSTHPIFVELDDQHRIPSWEVSYDDDDENNGLHAMVTFLDHVTRFNANGRLEPHSWFYHATSRNLVFSTPPTFKSHIAIILTVKLNT